MRIPAVRLLGSVSSSFVSAANAARGTCCRKLQAEIKKSALLRDSLDEERSEQQETAHREKVAIADLQAMIDLERSKLSDLQKALEREKTKVKDVCSALEAEKVSHRTELEKEQRLAQQLKTSLDIMEVRTCARDVTQPQSLVSVCWQDLL